MSVRAYRCGAICWLALCLHAQAQSTRPGWGATPFSENGVHGFTFRVWAPNASSVYVPGVFNGWNTTANALVQEGTSGVWSADIPGVQSGDAYKYHLNGNLWKRDPRGRRVVHSNSDTLAYDPLLYDWQNTGPLHPAIDDLVIYEMHIGTFYDSTPIDGLPGTFTDAIAKLDHLRALGITAVEVMPVTEFAGDISWGYNPADPFAVENIGYGGPDGFKNFVRACHERNIAVLLDVENNHYGPSDLDLWEFDGATGGGQGGGIYFYNDDPLCCTPWGARPNYSRPEVRRFIIDNTRMWLHEFRLDGFRWDSVYSIRNTTNNLPVPDGTVLLEEMLSEMAVDFPDTVQISEDSGLDLDFDAQWSFGYQNDIASFLQQTFDATRDMNVLAFWIDTAASARRVIYTESHDEVGDLNGGTRIPKRIDFAVPTSLKARRLSNLGTVFTLTAPGIPMLFMGQEVLEDRQFSTFNPMVWTKTNTFQGVFRLYQDLTRLRRNVFGTTAGLQGNNVNMLLVDNTEKLMSYHRWKNGGIADDVTVVCNVKSTAVSNASIPFPYAGTWYTHFKSDAAKYSTNYSNLGNPSVTATGSPPVATVDLAPYSAMIFSRAPAPPLDTDNDLMPDDWETSNGFNPLSPADALANPDGDRFNNMQEYQHGRDPHVWDPPLSAYSSMSAAGTFNDWDPEVRNMELVNNYTWQWVTTLNQNTDVVFKFTANGNWSTNWGDDNPSSSNIPLIGGAELSGSNIVFSGPPRGAFRFLFNEKSGSYSVEQLATAFTNIAVAGTFNNWDTAARNMKLLDHYKWQADTTLVYVTNPLFKYAADDTWSNNWGDNLQVNTVLPLSATGQTFGLDVQISGSLYGDYRFTFNELTASYRAERLPDTDRDINGLPDWWEKWRGLDTNSPPDADEDGMVNKSEYYADTNPNDSNSLLQIDGFARDPETGSLNVEWKGGIVVTQHLEQAEQSDGPWTRVYTNLPPTTVTNLLSIDPATVTGVFLRITADP